MPIFLDWPRPEDNDFAGTLAGEEFVGIAAENEDVPDEADTKVTVRTILGFWFMVVEAGVLEVLVKELDALVAVIVDVIACPFGSVLVVVVAKPLSDGVFGGYVGNISDQR